MRPGTKLTDRERLSRLLQYAELTSIQRNIFQRWLDNLTSGTLAQLSPRDRFWAETLYEELGVGNRRAEARKRARAKEEAVEATAIAALPLPKRPPGRA
jgi:hypothetical protein